MSSNGIAFVCGAALLAAGFVAGSWVRGDPSRPGGTVQLDGVTDLRDALVALRAEVGALREELQGPRLEAERSTATTAPPVPAAVAVETRTLRELVERLERALTGASTSAASARSSGASHALLAGSRSLGEILAAFRALGPDPEGDAIETLNTALTHEHSLWSVDDLVARFGVPTHVYGEQGGGLLLEYELVPGEELPMASFHVAAGRVTFVQVSG